MVMDLTAQIFFIVFGVPLMGAELGTIFCLCLSFFLLVLYTHMSGTFDLACDLRPASFIQ